MAFRGGELEVIHNVGFGATVHHRPERNLDCGRNGMVGGGRRDFRQIADHIRARIRNAKAADDARLVNVRRHIRANGHEELVRFRLAGFVGDLLPGSNVRVREVELAGVVEVRAGHGDFDGRSRFAAGGGNRGQTGGGKLGKGKLRSAQQRRQQRTMARDV